MFGISAALTTPFDNGGSVDHARLNRHIAGLRDAGCSSVTLFGTTGEGPSVAVEARLATLAAVIGAGTDPDRVILALHGAAAGDIVEQARTALAMGVSRFLLPPPCYFDHPPEAGLSDWFAAVFAPLSGSAAQVILYHIPQVTGVGLPVSLAAALGAAFPGLVLGVKDSSGDFDNTRELLKLPGLQILVGDERQLAAGARLGAAGAISGIANLFPERLARVLSSGKDDPVVNALVDRVVTYPVTPAIKAMVAHACADAAWRRCAPPLLAIDDEGSTALAKAHDAVARSPG